MADKKIPNNIEFDDGFREYTINGDPNKVIRIDTADYDLITRADTARKNIEQAVKKYDNIKINPDGSANCSDEEAIAAVTDLSNVIREQMNYIFNADVSSTVFGNASPLSTRKGIPLYERFFNAVIPIIEKDLSEENKQAQKRISKYTQQATRYVRK